MKGLIAVFKDTNGVIHNNIYYDYNLYFHDTFSPATKIMFLIKMEVNGKTYKERKEDLKQKAIEYQETWTEVDWSYGEIAEIESFFYTNGKRYGLLKEFHENVIL